VIGSPKPLLGRRERLELREAWLGEAADFRPWLAQPENIALVVGVKPEPESVRARISWRVRRLRQRFLRGQDPDIHITCTTAKGAVTAATIRPAARACWTA